MAAPMRKTYGIILQNFNQNLVIDTYKNVFRKSNMCIYSRNVVKQSCHRRFTTITGQNDSGYVNVIQPLKGNNSFCRRIGIVSNSHILKSSCVKHNCDNVYICVSRSCSNGSSQKPSPQDNTNEPASQDVSVRENIYTVPNLLTLSRIVMTPVIGYMVIEERFYVACVMFFVAGVTDLLDGYIARNFKNQMSAFGTALDPLADKILITTMTVTLTVANLLPLPLAVLIIGRDALLILTGFVIRYVSLPPPFTLKRYFDVTNPTAKLLPSTLSKYNTALQLSLVCFTLAAPVFNFVDHPALKALWYITGATTLTSGIDYIVNWKKYIQFLKKR